MMPRATNYDFLGQTPPADVVGNSTTTIIADNLILFMDVPRGIVRVVKLNGSYNDRMYDPQHQVIKQFSTVTDGIKILPGFRDAVKILSLTVL